MAEKGQQESVDAEFRLHKHWVILLAVAAVLGFILMITSSLNKWEEAKNARQTEIEYLTSRLSEAEQRIDVLEKSNSFAEAALAKEAADERDREQRNANLERLRANERLIESNQQMLCDATGDC